MSDMRVDYQGLRSLVEDGARRPQGPSAGRLSPGRLLRGLVAWVVVAVLLAVAPFFVLVRSAVAAHQGWGLGAWTSLGVGVLAISAVLGLYSWAMGRWLGAGPGARRFLNRGAVALGLAFVLYGVVWVGASHAPGEGVRAEYRTLHPVLRVATGLVFLADPGRVMTDGARTPDDYRLMGLPPVEASLHFRQDDGFAHAVDFRTRGRPEWGNRTVELGFWLLGFHALRHRGTADHLHVSLRGGAS